jgi:hypothetical protein
MVKRLAHGCPDGDEEASRAVAGGDGVGGSATPLSNARKTPSYSEVDYTAGAPVLPSIEARTRFV